MKNFLFLLLIMSAACTTKKETVHNPFKGKIEPLSINGSFRMDDHIVWGGSVIKHEDRYYMFVSVYPDSCGRNTWITNSRVALAVSDNPEGPYEFMKFVLPYRDKKFWDGMMTHNPSIRKHEGNYYLFYIGNTYDFERPCGGMSNRDPRFHQAFSNQRIGVATAKHPEGPWERYDQPVIEPREGHWDLTITSNPAPVIHDDGSVTLIYKSTNMFFPERLERHNKDGLPRFIIGAARADHPLGEYERLGEYDGLIKIEDTLSSLEDPFLWHDGERFNMLIKNFEKDIIEETGAAIYVWSDNGYEWYLPEDDPTVYTREVTWKEGLTTTQKKLERPQILMEDGKPAYIFLGTDFREDFHDTIENPVKTYNVVFKVKQE